MAETGGTLASWISLGPKNAYRAVPRLKPFARYLFIASMTTAAGRNARVPAASRSTKSGVLLVAPSPDQTPTDTDLVKGPVMITEIRYSFQTRMNPKIAVI